MLKLEAVCSGLEIELSSRFTVKSLRADSSYPESTKARHRELVFGLGINTVSSRIHHHTNPSLMLEVRPGYKHRGLHVMAWRLNGFDVGLDPQAADNRVRLNSRLSFKLHKLAEAQQPRLSMP